MRYEEALTIDLKSGERVWALFVSLSGDAMLVLYQGRQRLIGKHEVEKIMKGWVTN